MNIAFDPAAAAKTYADMDTEELVRIAYPEPDIRQVRAEIKARDRAAESVSARNREQIDTLKFRIAAGTLIGGLWVVALFAPTIFKDWSEPTDGTGLFLLGAWAIAVVDAVRKARRGARRRLYLVVVIPAVLLAVGVVIRWFK